MDFEVGAIANGEKTYQTIAQALKQGRSCLIAWTDGKGSQYDVMFTLRPLIAGSVGGGARNWRIVVSVMRNGAFGFNLSQHELLHGDYVAEKLNMEPSPTTFALADLISGVHKALDAARDA